MNRFPLFAIIAVLVYLSLVPWTFDFTRPFHHPVWQTPRNAGEIADSVINVFVYIPLGFAAVRTLGRFWISLWTGILLSVAVEYLQVFLPSRDSSWRDVVLNSAGTLLGCCASRLPLVIPSLPRLPAGGLLCAALWFTAHCYPFLPVLRMTSVYRLQSTLLHWTWNGNAALDASAAGVILCLVLPRTYAAAALFVPLLLEPLILGQQLQPSALAGAVAGYGLGFVLPAPHAGLLLYCWIAMRQLQPFTWSPEARAFQWIPFASLPDLPTPAYLRILILKLLLYCGAVRLALLSGLRLRDATLALVALLAISEALQTHLPGRTPESTDLALALLGAILTLRISGRQSATSPL